MSSNAFPTFNNDEPSCGHQSRRSSQNSYHQNGSVSTSNLINHAELNEVPQPFNVSILDNDNSTDTAKNEKEVPQPFNVSILDNDDDDDDCNYCSCCLKDYRETYKKLHGVDYYDLSVNELFYQYDKVMTRIPDLNRRIAFKARLEELIEPGSEDYLMLKSYEDDNENYHDDDDDYDDDDDDDYDEDYEDEDDDEDDDLSYNSSSSSSISTITLDLNCKKNKSDDCTIDLETGVVNIPLDGSRLERGSENRGFWIEKEEDSMQEDLMEYYHDEESHHNYDSESEESRHRETDRNNTHTPNQPRREEDYRPCSCSEHQHDLYTRVACTYDRVMGKK